MAIVEALESNPFHQIVYQYPGGRDSLKTAVYPISRGNMRCPSGNVQAVFVTSDLQGLEPSWIAQGRQHSLGEVVAEELALLAEIEEIPTPDQIGVILAGDLFAGTGEGGRGRSGDAAAVWEAFANRFAWVAGVGGNHDRFPEKWPTEDNAYYLDGDAKNIGALQIAGISGIIGNVSKPMRWAEDAYLKRLDRLLASSPDILVLHEGPDFPEKGFIGSDAIRSVLAAYPEQLVISGHCHWEEPLASFVNGLQVLNVDGRGFLLDLTVE